MLRTAKRLALLGLVSATVLLGIAAPAGASTGVSSRPAGVTGSGGDFVAAAGTVGFSVTKKFANTAGATYYTLNWTENHVANGASWRVVWQGFYLNGSGQTIAKTNKVRVNCL